MKKVFIILGGLFLLTFSSCQKDEDTRPTQLDEEYINKNVFFSISKNTDETNNDPNVPLPQWLGTAVVWDMAQEPKTLRLTGDLWYPTETGEAVYELDVILYPEDFSSSKNHLKWTKTNDDLNPKAYLDGSNRLQGSWEDFQAVISWKNGSQKIKNLKLEVLN
ncbi:hypothetical protein H6776_00520 [Candidatus Nomurabacteria bacterium]|nr:hypothetical protein [Candidatus Nomurabacteria bacterium]